MERDSTAKDLKQFTVRTSTEKEDKVFNSQTLSIGRYRGCAWYLQNVPPDVSRCQGIFLQIPSKQVVAFIDCWSLLGSKIISRDDGGMCYSSLPNKRKVLIVPDNVAFQLLVGWNTIINVQPK